MAGRDPYYSNWPYSNQADDRSDPDEESGQDVRNSRSDSTGSNYYGQGVMMGYGRGSDDYARYLSNAFGRPFSGSDSYNHERSQSSADPENEVSQSDDVQDAINSSLQKDGSNGIDNDTSSLSSAIIEHSLNRSMRIQEELEEAGRRELERSANVSRNEAGLQQNSSNMYADVNEINIQIGDNGKADSPVSELSHVIEDLLTKPIKKLQEAKQYPFHQPTSPDDAYKTLNPQSFLARKDPALVNDLDANFHSWLQPLTLPSESNLAQNGSKADHFHLETLHLLMSSFRGKVHAELEESFSALLERSQSIRTDVLSMLEQSISELESRLTVRLELGDQRRDLKDVEARRAQQNELMLLRAEIQRIVSQQRGRVDEVMQRLEAMDRAFAQMKLLQEQLKDGSVKIPKKPKQGTSIIGETTDANEYETDEDGTTQKLVLRLEKLVFGLEREISHTKAALERKLLENHSQLLRAQGVFAQLLESEEKSQQERDQLIRETFSATRSELEQYLDAALVDSNSKHAALREQVVAIESAKEEFASQLKRIEERPEPLALSDLRALDSEIKAILVPTAAQTRILTRKLDALSESFEEAANAASLFSHQNALETNTADSTGKRNDKNAQPSPAAFLLHLGAFTSMSDTDSSRKEEELGGSSSRSSAMLRAVENISRQRAEFELKWGARWAKIEAAVGQLEQLESNAQQSNRAIETLKSDFDASLGSLRSDLSGTERRLEVSHLQLQKRFDASLTPSALVQTIEKDINAIAEKAVERAYARGKTTLGNTHDNYATEASNDIALKALTAVQNSLAQISSDNRDLREDLAQESKKRREDQTGVRDYVNRELAHHLRIVNEGHEADRISWNRTIDSLRMQIDSISTSEAAVLSQLGDLKGKMEYIQGNSGTNLGSDKATAVDSLSTQAMQSQIELQSQSIKMLKDSLQSAINRAEESERMAVESTSAAARAQSLAETLSVRLGKLETTLGSLNFATESGTSKSSFADVANLRESVRLEVAASMQMQTDNLRSENENLRLRVDDLEKQWLEERTARLAIEEAVSKLVDPSAGMEARIREVEMTLTSRRSYLSTTSLGVKDNLELSSSNPLNQTLSQNANREQPDKSLLNSSHSVEPAIIGSTQSLEDSGQDSRSSDNLYIDLDSTELSDAQSAVPTGTSETEIVEKSTKSSPSPQKTSVDSNQSFQMPTDKQINEGMQVKTTSTEVKVPVIPKLDFSKLTTSVDGSNKEPTTRSGGEGNRAKEENKDPTQDSLNMTVSASAMFDNLDLDDLVDESVHSYHENRKSEGSLNGLEPTAQPLVEKKGSNGISSDSQTTSSHLNESSDISLSLDDTDPQISKSTLLERLDASRKQRNSNQVLSNRVANELGTDNSRQAELNDSKISNGLDSSLELDSTSLSLSKSLTPNRLTPIVPQRPNKPTAYKPQNPRQQLKPIPPVQSSQSPLNSSAVSDKSNVSNTSIAIQSHATSEQDVASVVSQQSLKDIKPRQEEPETTSEQRVENVAQTKETDITEDDDEFDLDVNSILY